MLTAKRSFFLLFCALSFTISALADDVPINDFEIGTQKELSLKRNAFAYFKFRITEITPKYDLSVIAHPRGDNDPELFLATGNQYPSKRDDSEYFSTSVGYSSIYIPSADIKLNTDYYLGVSCASEVCDFNLTVDYAQEYYMREYIEDVIIDYVDGGTVVARVYIPPRATIHHILFAAEVESQVESDQSLHMYVNKGNEIPTSSKSDIVALAAWKDGKAAIIYSDDQQRFCTNCNYTIVIEAPRKSKVIFRRTLYGDQIPFDLNDERNDAVELGSNVTYAVNISQFDVDVSFIIVEVIPYFGKTKVLANLGTLPTKYEDYAFNLSGWGQELLFIPVQAKPANNLLYVTVDGTTYSTYSIRIYSMNKKNMVLKLGEPEVGYILNEEVESFLLTAVGRKNMKMTFSLHPDQGKVNLFVKTCDEKTNCQFTKDETQSILNGTTPTSIKTPILQYANITAGDDSIEFDMDGSVCEASSNRGAPICYFAVAVLGASPGSSKFTLTASRADLPQALRVSRTVKEHLSVDQYKYYYFTVTDDTNIESVNFQITKISGSVDIYISRKTKYPDSRDKEEFHHYNDLYSFERSHFPVLNGTYYIAIKGFTSATYSIVPIVRYNTTGDDLGGHHLIKLREGVPQKIVIDNLEPAYFKFEAAVADVQAQGLEVSLDEVQGHFVICAGTGPELPSIGRCQFESNTTTLVIEKGSIGTLNQGDAHFDPMATYLVAVFPKTIKQTDDDDDDAKPIKPKVQSFSITWAGLHTYRTISFGIPWTNSIKKDRVIYYKIEAHPGEDKEIVIHRTTDASSPSLYTVTLYLANRETKLGHNVSVFSPDRTLTTGDTLKLKEADINSLCEDTEGNKCYLFLAAATDSDSEVSYTLTITKDFDDLRISESVQATYTFPSKGHPIHLYYYPHRLEDITILSHTYGRNITLFANVINTRDHSSRSGWIFPTNRTYEFISKSSVAHAGESRLFIPAGELSSCGADYDKFRCGIALTLYYDVPQDVDDFFKDFALFSIMANQEVTPIAAGKPIHTSVNEGTYAYFSLYVNKDEATLLISANVLSGKHVVILASKGRDARPTMDNAEFRSYYGKMETLQVSGDQTVGGTAKGYWVIAVYGYSETEFVLTVLFEKTKMVELHRGLPLNLDVTTDPVYFEYYHESNSSFTFKFAKERGNGRISIKTFKEGEAVADGLPTEFRGDIVRPFEYFQNVIEVSNRSEAFCSKCMYVVGIFPRSEMKISVVAQLPGQFIFLQDNMIFTDSASSTTFNKYEYISYPDATLDINLVVYSGEPHIYVSHNPTVNNTHYLWKYTDISTNNYVRMRLDNTPYSTQSSLDPVFDGTKNVTTFKNVYFIMITAPINTNYSIAVSISNSTRVLVDGHLDFGFLNPGEFNLYKYHVSKDDIADNSTNRLKLQFTLHKDKFTATLREELTRPDIVVMSVPHKSYNNASINPYSLMPDLPVLTPIRDDELGKAFGDQHYTLNLQYVAAADQDFYIVVNNTKSEKHLNYSIVANSHEPLFLTMNNFHAARTAVGESEIYAVHADNKGLLVIEIHECMGRVSVQTSNTRNFVNAPIEAIDDTTQDSNGPAVDDETFNDDAKGKNAPVLNELTDSSMGSQIKLASINIEQEQTVYIIVTATEGLRDDDNIDEKEAVYKIRVNLHPLRNFMPFKSLSPGMEGAVTWDIPSSGKVKLGFSDVQNTAVVDKAIKTAKFGNLNITYKYEAFVTKHPVTGKFMARCDMLPKKQGYFKSIDLYQKTVAFDRESLTTDPNDESMKYVELDVEPTYQTQYATIRVTALGVDSNGNAVWDYPIIYKTTEFKSGTTILGVGSQTFLVVLLIVCVIMLIAAVIGLYYYYNKFQRVKAKLNYEMQDLRNMTNVVESFDMLDDDRGHTKAGYSGLMEDNNM